MAQDSFLHFSAPLIMYTGFRATLNFRQFKVALNPICRLFLKYAESCELSRSGLEFCNKNRGSPDLFLSYRHLKLKLRVFLTDYTVATATCNVKTIIITFSPVNGHLFNYRNCSVN